MAHPIPDDALIDHLAVLAKTGAGKTYMAKGIVERLLSERRRVCIVDPKNAWWGLKSSADGKSPAFPIVVFGGPKADVPLLAAHGKVLGEAVATTHLSCIICTKGMPESERIRFLTEFFQTLDMKNSEPLHLVLDEAHMMAPQKPLGEMQRLTHWTSELVSGGRGMGFRVMLLSQRPARLNKDVLTQCESLVAMRMTGPQDRDAVKNWIHDQADLDKGKEIIASLPGLPDGEGWFWAPARDILKRVKFPLITTYDNSKTKRDSGADEKAKLAPVDLSVLQDKLAKVKAEIEAADPKALKAEVARLTKELAKKQPAATGGVSTEDAVRLRSEGYNAGWAAALKETKKAHAVTARAFDSARATLTRIASLANAGAAAIPMSAADDERPTSTPLPATPASTRPVTARTTPQPVTVPAEGITRPQQRVLDALAWWEAAGHEQPSREQVAGVARYSPTSGGYNNLIGSLTTAGLVVIPSPGLVQLTSAGSQIAQCDGAPSIDDLHARVRETLSEPQWKVLSAAIGEHPQAVTREQLGELTGYSASSGGFNNLIGSLTTLKMLEIPAKGSVRAADWLFEVRP